MPRRYPCWLLLGAIFALGAPSGAVASPDGSASASRAGERTSTRRPSQLDRRLGRYGAESRLPVGAPPSASAAKAAYSVGTASDGRLVDGVEMPLDGDSWRFIPSVSTRKTNFATQQIIGAITRASATVQSKWPDATMLVGNMSVEGGGDIVQSVSHNSGRDADVAFYVVDGEAESCTLDHFALMDKGGNQVNCDGKQRFDAARNWRFVRALLTDPGAQIQWVFISTPLRELLLEQARKEDADDELYRKAAAVLHQPRDSSPHADHFHIRVYCSRDDLLEGCINTGPIWDWVETWDADLRAHIAVLLERLGSKEPKERLEALAALDRLQARAAGPFLTKLVTEDPSPEVRRAALRLLSRLGTGDLRAVLERLAIDGTDTDMQLQAIRRLAKAGTTATVPLLIRAIDAPDRPMRDELRTTLAYLTNTRLEPGKGPGDAVTRLKTRWLDWYKENRTDTWAQWMRQGFEEAGISFRGKMMRNQSIPTLIRATSKPGHIGYNAQRVLSALTGNQVDPSRRQGTAALTYWKTWWSRNHKQFGFKRPTL